MFNDLQITGFDEWIYEDFETSIDNYGLAFIELNEIAKWLKEHDFDIGIPIKEDDAEARFAK